MKVLLINPPRLTSISSEVPTTVNAETNTIPPLGLMYLEAYLHAYAPHHEVKIIDCLAEGYDHEDTADIIRREQPDLIGLTGHTHDLLDMLKVSENAKKVSPEIKVCWGGPHVSDFSMQTMRYNCVDICIPFEGEQPFCETVECLAKGKAPEDVPGVYYKKDGEILFTGKRPTVADLDKLPFPRRDILDYKKYHYVLGNADVTTTLITSRGCPYKCNFCNTPGHSTWRWRSAQSIANEMEECANLGINEIYIVDDTFNVRVKRTLELCDEIVKRGLKINWNIRARVNLITEETVAAMKKAGCTRVHIGVESGTDEGMKALNKELTTAQVRKGFNILKKSGMTTVCYFMIGCPHEKTVNDIIQTVNFAKELDPDYALFGVLTPYPQTALYDEGVRRGILDPNHWENFLKNPTPDFKPQVWTESFTPEQLAEYCDLCFKRFYLRPKQMFRKLLEIKGWKDLSRKLKAGWEIVKL